MPAPSRPAASISARALVNKISSLSLALARAACPEPLRLARDLRALLCRAAAAPAASSWKRCRWQQEQAQQHCCRYALEGRKSWESGISDFSSMSHSVSAAAALVDGALSLTRVTVLQALRSHFQSMSSPEWIFVIVNCWRVNFF
jgi:hypothetical protein